jgi:hypothetical protein
VRHDSPETIYAELQRRGLNVVAPVTLLQG